MIEPNDGWKIGDQCWVNGDMYHVQGTYQGNWYVKNALHEDRYRLEVPAGYTLYYICHPKLGMGSTYLCLDIRFGLPKTRNTLSVLNNNF